MKLIKKLKKTIAIKFSLGKDPTKRIISFWERDGADFEYFKSADQQDWLNVFWDNNSLFYKMFQKIDPEYSLEIACGTGRHSARVIDRIKYLYLLDSSKGALKIAKERFSNHINVTYIHNESGYGIPGIINDNSLSAVFSYDAMVHFEKEAVFSYVKDSFRVLKEGGFALFHHSNYDKNPGGKFTENPGWRNFMTKGLFTSYAKECGFEIIHSEVISFSTANSDCITLLKKVKGAYEIF